MAMVVVLPVSGVGDRDCRRDGTTTTVLAGDSGVWLPPPLAQPAWLSRNASANPRTVASPTLEPPPSTASGSIVSDSIVRIAPPANAWIRPIVLGEASPRTA